jgi:hypothetical protein
MIGEIRMKTVIRSKQYLIVFFKRRSPPDQISNFKRVYYPLKDILKNKQFKTIERIREWWAKNPTSNHASQPRNNTCSNVSPS